MKILSVAADLFHAGGRTDRHTVRHQKVSSRFWQILRNRLKSTKRIR